MSSATRRVTLAAAVALALPLSAPAEPPPARDWDQEAVAGLARKLAEDTKGIREAFRNEPPAREVSAESYARYYLLDLLRRIEGETRHLADELAAGRGHDETLPVYSNLLELVREAREKRLQVQPEGETLRRIEQARAHLEQLDPYYDQDVPLPEPVR